MVTPAFSVLRNALSSHYFVYQAEASAETCVSYPSSAIGRSRKQHSNFVKILAGQQAMEKFGCSRSQKSAGLASRKPASAICNCLTAKEAAVLSQVGASWLAKARMRGGGPPDIKVGAEARLRRLRISRDV